MADDQEAQFFEEDIRVKFVEEKVCELLRLNRPTWEKNFADEEFQAQLKNFFEKESVIFFWSSTKGCLDVSNEVRFFHNPQ